MSGSAVKRLLSRAQMRLADRSDACEGPGWARTEHMQQESGYVGGVPKMAAGAEAFLEDAVPVWLLAGLTAERARAVGSGWNARTCTRRWLWPTCGLPPSVACSWIA